MIDEKRYNERAKRIYKYQRIAGRNVKINDTSIESRLMAVPIIQALISGMPAFILIAMRAGETSNAKTISTPASRTELVTVIAKVTKNMTSFTIPCAFL